MKYMFYLIMVFVGGWIFNLMYYNHTLIASLSNLHKLCKCNTNVFNQNNQVWTFMTTLHKKWSFPLRISSVNVTKSKLFVQCSVFWTQMSAIKFQNISHQVINLWSLLKDRSSHPEVFYQKGILKSFAKFTGKNLWESLFFNNVASLKPATLLKKRFWHMCFPLNFGKFLRTYFL